MRFALVVTLVLVACGTAPDYLPECTKALELDEPNRYFELSQNFAFARQLLIESGIVPEAEFCDTYKVVTFKVRAVISLDNFGEHAAGLFSCKNGKPGDECVVEIARAQHALLHEMIHDVDAARRTWALTTFHDSWPQLGFTLVDVQFQKEHPYK